MDANNFEKHIPIESADKTAIDHLTENTDFSKQQLKKIMQKGAVWLTHGDSTQRIRRVKRKLTPGDELHLYYNPAVLNAEPPEPTLISDEGKYSIWFKPSGLRSQGSKYGDHCSIARWVETNLKPERTSFIVHRLDQAACGLILVAHTKEAATKLSALFADRDIQKSYRALVKGELSTPDKPITCDQPIDEKNAVSHISARHYDAETDRTLVQVDIETGRKHQIRRHLSESGFPIVGDRLYGNCEDENLCLAAYRLSFNCPFSQESQEYKLTGDLLPPTLVLHENE